MASTRELNSLNTFLHSNKIKPDANIDTTQKYVTAPNATDNKSTRQISMTNQFIEKAGLQLKNIGLKESNNFQEDKNEKTISRNPGFDSMGSDL